MKPEPSVTSDTAAVTADPAAVTDTRAALATATLRRALRGCRDSSLVRNSVYLMATTVVTSLSGYVYWIVAARAYSPHVVGLAAALIAAITLASTITSAGLAAMLVQMLPRRAAGAAWSLTVNATLMTGVLASVVLGVAAVGVLPLLSDSFGVLWDDPLAAVLLVAGVLFMAVGVLLDYTYVAERAAGHMLVRNIVFSLVRIPLLLAPVTALTSSDTDVVLGAWVVSAALSSAVGMALVPRVRPGYGFGSRGLYRHVLSLRDALAGHNLISVGGGLPVYVLPMLVAALLSPTDNAYFYTAWMVANAMFMVPAALSYSLFAEGSHEERALDHQVRVSAITSAVLLGPLMLILLAGGRLIVAPFGPGYPEHVVPVLSLLAISAVPQTVFSIYVSVLRVRDRLRFAAILSVAKTVVTLGLAAALMMLVGLIGAAWGVLISDILAALVVPVDLRRQRRRLRRVGGAR